MSFHWEGDKEGKRGTPSFPSFPPKERKNPQQAANPRRGKKGGGLLSIAFEGKAQGGKKKGPIVLSPPRGEKRQSEGVH